MNETAVNSPLVMTKPQEGEPHRRIIEGDDFSEVDFSRPEIRQALKDAYRVLLKYRARRLSEQSEEK